MAWAPMAARAAASQSRAGTPPPMRCQTAAASRAAAGSAAMAALHCVGGADLGGGRPGRGGEERGEEKASHGRRASAKDGR